MSILVIQGPHRGAGGRASAQKALMESMEDCANALGTTVSSRTCSTVAELSACLGGSCPADTEMMLLDSGDLDAGDLETNSGELRSAIDQLGFPYIEVHDDSAQSLEPRLRLAHCPMATVIIKNNLKESYLLAMAIAARRHRRQTGDGA